MWTSERNRNLPLREAPAEVGTVTLGGDPAGVSVGGERRWLNVYSPGGYSWRPTSGDKVLVLKAGAEGESPCILGTTQKGSDLKPGEVRLTGVDCALFLGQGQVELTGKLCINGQPLEELVQGIVQGILSKMQSGGM